MEIDSSNSQPTSLVDKIVVPGDVVLDLSKMTNQTIKLGAGLHQECDTLSAMKAGKLRFVVESSNKRYIPCVEDTILGIVVDSKPGMKPSHFVSLATTSSGLTADAKPVVKGWASLY